MEVVGDDGGAHAEEALEGLELGDVARRALVGEQLARDADAARRVGHVDHRPLVVRRDLDRGVDLAGSRPADQQDFALGPAGAREDLKAMKDFGTVQGGRVKIDTTKGLKINDATVIKADVSASNGVIHVIDTVLLPK